VPLSLFAAVTWFDLPLGVIYCVNVVHFIADLWLHFSCGFSCWVILWIVAFSGPACEVVKYLETAMDCGRCAGGHEVL